MWEMVIGSPSDRSLSQAGACIQYRQISSIYFSFICLILNKNAMSSLIYHELTSKRCHTVPYHHLESENDCFNFNAKVVRVVLLDDSVGQVRVCNV
jgi:hypothetical protein